MKTSSTVLPIRFDSAERRRMEALVNRHLCDLFDRLPALSGFRLRDDLILADLSVFSWPSLTPIRGMDEIVMQSLVELAESDPEAVVLMRGRTFTRCLH
jgi:hypothetical protein